MRGHLELVASYFGLDGVSLVFVIACASFLLSFFLVIYLARLRRHERDFQVAKARHYIGKEVHQRRLELAELINEQFEFMIKHFKIVVESQSMDQCEEAMRWVLSKRSGLDKLTFQVKRFFGKDIGGRFVEILDRIQVISRYNEAKSSYEVLLLNRKETDLIFKRLIIKMESLIEAITKGVDHIA